MAVDDQGVEEEAQTRQWLEGVALRERHAFEALYKHYSRRVYAFICQRCDDQALAEEVVVDSMLQVWHQPHAFHGQARFSTWLLSLARFKMIDKLRSLGRAHEDIEAMAEQLADQTPSQAEQLAQAQNTRLLHECLKRLAPTHREVVHLVYFEDCPLAEVAHVQAAPEGTIKSRLAHARLRLAQCLQKRGLASAALG